MKANSRATSKSTESAAAFVKTARDNGWSVQTTHGTSVVTIAKQFTPNDSAAFRDCDATYYGILSLVPARGGSTWGTDGSGVGGYSATIHGRFEMNVSGVNKTFLAALNKLLGK